MNRPRNLWSPEEDNTLKKLVETCAEKDKVDWRRIASFLPGRNNKDCRKRWHYRVSATMNLGPWSPSEDDLLRIGIGRHGTHWSRVAQVVVTRNGDQCFKRWNDVLDPAINRSPWTRDEDRRLLDAIEKHGRAWKHIVDTHFPGRTGLDAKNRHRQLTRKRKREHQPPTKSSRTVKREQLSSRQHSQIQGQARTQTSTQHYIAQTVPSPLPQLSPTSSSSPSSSVVATPTVLISPQQNPIDILSAPALGAGSPAFSSFCWDSPIDGMFGPSLPLSTHTPATPYSPCSSSLSNSTFESNPSQYNEDHVHHPHPSQQFDSRELLAHEVPVQFPYFHNSTSHSRMLDVDVHSQHLSLFQGHQHTFSDPHPHSHSHTHTPSHMHSPLHVQMHRMQSRSADEMLPLHSEIVVSSPFHTQGILSTHNLNHHPSYPVDGFGY